MIWYADSYGGMPNELIITSRNNRRAAVSLGPE